jgi:integrase
MAALPHKIRLLGGLRPDEVNRLRWSENVRNGAIEVHTGKGTGSRRRIETTERFADLLAGLNLSKSLVFMVRPEGLEPPT